jgi:hypothetical protein
MKQCDCIKRVNGKCKETLKVDNGSLDHEMLSGRTYTDFNYNVQYAATGKVKSKHLSVFHTYCPFCGKKYEGNLDDSNAL